MAKTYYLQFGSGDPRQFFGLAPTFLTFNNNGTAVTPPGISNVVGATGFYSFSWGTTTPIVFLADAATTSPGTNGRYVSGALDPVDRSDEYGTTMIAIGTSLMAQGVSLFAQGSTSLGYGFSVFAGLGFQGTTLVGIGTTLTGVGNTLGAIGATTSALGALVGDTTSSFGSTSIDPTTVFGFLKRVQEVQEGDQVYAKSTGIYDVYSRGSSTLLREKTISDTSTQTTKT